MTINTLGDNIDNVIKNRFIIIKPRRSQHSTTFIHDVRWCWWYYERPWLSGFRIHFYKHLRLIKTELVAYVFIYCLSWITFFVAFTWEQVPSDSFISHHQSVWNFILSINIMSEFFVMVFQGLYSAAGILCISFVVTCAGA